LSIKRGRASFVSAASPSPRIMAPEAPFPASVTVADLRSFPPISGARSVAIVVTS
jgi:hypothetical protein